MKDSPKLYNNEQFVEINNSNFEKEGEYFIDQKPKYKYELKIIHQNPNKINLKRPLTPNRIISSFNFSILINKKRNKKSILKQKRHKYKYHNRARTPEINSTKRLYKKKYKKKGLKKNKNYDKGNYCYNFQNDDYKYINNNCICQREFNKIFSNYIPTRNIRNKVCKCGNIFGKNNNINNNIYQNNKKYFENDKKNIDDNSYLYSPHRNNNILNNESKIITLKKYTNNNLHKGSSSSYKMRKKAKKYKNKILKLSLDNTENNIYYDTTSNCSFLSIDETKQNLKNKKTNNYHISPSPIKKEEKKNYISSQRFQNFNNSKNNNLSNINLSSRSNSKKNNNIIISKSSETKQNIKIIPLGEKIEPLIIKKVVQKPKVVKIINKDGSNTEMIKQNSIVTSIESKRIMDNEKESVVQESTTKVFTTLTKNLENKNDNDLSDINDKNNDYEDRDKNDINYQNKKIIINNEAENNTFFIRRDFKNKNENDCKFEVINNNPLNNINIGKNYSINNIINIQNQRDNTNTNNNIKNMEINDNSIISKVSDYSSIGNNLNFADNKIFSKKEQLNYIKNLFLNDLNKLDNYFQNLPEEEKKYILTTLNNGSKEDKKLYMHLKNKKNNEEEEIAIIINNNDMEEKSKNNNKE